MKKIFLLTLLLAPLALAQNDFTFEGIPNPATAGESYTITITATEPTQDVNLRLVVDGNPETYVRDTIISFGGNTSKIESIFFTYAGENVVLRCIDPNDGDTGDSDPFDVIPGSAYRWRIIAPGQSEAPGTPSGKSGTASVTAADPDDYYVELCDEWFNEVVDTDDPDSIATTDPFVLPITNPVQGTNNFALRTEGSRTVTIYGGSYLSNSSTVRVDNGPASQLLLVCEEEERLPGDTLTVGSPGKTGSPIIAEVGSDYWVTVYAVDDAWNLDPTFTCDSVYVVNDASPPSRISDIGSLSEGVVSLRVIFSQPNALGEDIFAVGCGLESEYPTTVVVGGEVHHVTATLNPAIVPPGVYSDLTVEVYRDSLNKTGAGQPVFVELTDSTLSEDFWLAKPLASDSVHDTITIYTDENGDAICKVWGMVDTIYPLKATAAEKEVEINLVVRELTELLIFPNPYKYADHGDVPINFNYKVEQAGATEVYLLVADPFGNIVYTASYGSETTQATPGQQTIAWEGLNSNGVRVSSGMYQAVMKITLKNGVETVLKKNFILVW